MSGKRAAAAPQTAMIAAKFNSNKNATELALNAIVSYYARCNHLFSIILQWLLIMLLCGD